MLFAADMLYKPVLLLVFQNGSKFIAVYIDIKTNKKQQQLSFDLLVSVPVYVFVW